VSWVDICEGVAVQDIGHYLPWNRWQE